MERSPDWLIVVKRVIVHARDFFANEWANALTGTAVGVIGAIFKVLLVDDKAFRASLSKHWTRLAALPGFSGPNFYLSFIAVLAGLLATILILKLLPFFLKAFKSWIFGIVSGLFALCGVSFFVFFSQHSLLPFQRLKYAVSTAGFFTLVSLALRIRALESPPRTPESISFAVPRRDPNVVQENKAFSKLDADCPIQEWEQDVLGRSALVESLARTVMMSKAPVVAIQGPFGDGKSSVLNLLKRTLESHAIVVGFSTWLPGSEQTLAIDVFNDIATECKKQYYLPQLRRRLLAYAKTVCGTISFLKSASELFPSISQREEIEEMGSALNRVPRRIVVLLDEIDRLQKEELQVLLKILRGVPLFPNLSFVCAFAQTEVEKILFEEQNSESREYFEKFFPVSFAVPKPDAALLFRVLQSRLATVWDDLKWFQNDQEKKEFNEDLQKLWDETLIQLCTNLRKIAFVVNDISVAARRLVREVNALDVVIVEILRRFFPVVYESVWRHQSQFADLQLSWKSAFRSDDAIKKEQVTFFDGVRATLGGYSQAKEAGDLLAYLFPAYKKYSSDVHNFTGRLHTSDLEAAEKEKRIFHPDFFASYFRYQVPETMYSETEVEAFINEMNSLSSIHDCIRAFSDFFAAIPKESPRREDFLHRITRSIDRFQDLQAEALAYSVAQHATEYVYDSIMFTVAEAGRALVIVFQVAQRFSNSDKVQHILERSITGSTDDTFAIRLLTLSTEQERNKILVDFTHVNPERLKQVFAERMERRYGHDANISKVKISEGDRAAFVMWAKYSDETREIEIDFWRRFIGSSPARLVQALDFIFPVRGTIWDVDPTPHVDLLFPIAEFSKVLEALPRDEHSDAKENEAIDRLRRLISGEFKNGIPHKW